MKFMKPALTVEQQADLLLSRGLRADRENLIQTLSQVNYYRLSAYWYPFRSEHDLNFVPSTSFPVIWEHYVFDRQLRVIVMDAIERVEVAIKTRIAQALVLKYGPFAHENREHLPNLSSRGHRRLRDKIDREEDRSHEEFVKSYHAKYTSETRVPLWMGIELMDFGSMLTLYRGCDLYTKRDIARLYGVSAAVLESWLHSLNYVRNLCAHHGRLWNRHHPVAPKIPDRKNLPCFHDPVRIQGASTFTALSILRYLLRYIAPQSQWAERLEALWTQKHPDINIRRMGFPPDWNASPIWSPQP